MSSNLSPEELEALAGSGGRSEAAVAPVTQWDTGRIQRLSSDDVAEARRRIGRTLPRIEELFAELAGLRIEARIGACHELDADGLLDAVEDPPALVTFRVGGQPGWCLWDNPIAVATIEDVLGGAPPATDDDEEEEDEESEDAAADEADGAQAADDAAADGESADAEEDEDAEPKPKPFDPEEYRRFLTPLERKVLVRVLRIAIDEVAAVVGVEVGEYDAVSMLKHAPTWRESTGARPDPHRLAVELVLETERGETHLAIHLPMAGARGPLEPGAEEIEAALRAASVPAHLDRVPVQVQATLGDADLTLADLVGLEAGDVIPIEAAVGDPVELLADGVPFASGILGAHRGHVAVRIDAHGTRDLTESAPNADTQPGS